LSEVQAIGGGNVRAAIARAASRSGVDFDFLLAQARIESGLNPGARAGTSSAAGLYQFTKGTWLRTLEAHGAEHGLEWASAAIEDGRLRDPAMRSAVMALRFDPDASAAMAAELAQDNAAALTPVLGREPDAAELYLAHFLGSGGAAQFLSALQSDPGQSAAALMPKAATANRAIFFGAGGTPRSVGGVMELLRGKVDAAMERTGLPSSSGEGIEGWGLFPSAASPFVASPHPTPSPQGEGISPPQRPSMADTLRDTFGLASAQGHASAPGFVRAAYGNLKSLGL
jgi:hypothetical protein